MTIKPPQDFHFPQDITGAKRREWGNFREWSIITIHNDPSNPQQPPATHPFHTFSTSKYLWTQLLKWSQVVQLKEGPATWSLPGLFRFSSPPLLGFADEPRIFMTNKHTVWILKHLKSSTENMVLVPKCSHVMITHMGIMMDYSRYWSSPILDKLYPICLTKLNIFSMISTDWQLKNGCFGSWLTKAITLWWFWAQLDFSGLALRRRSCLGDLETSNVFFWAPAGPGKSPQNL